MELSELAERVLLATTLEDKLQCPASITDEQPGTAIVAPSAPGRPPELRFKPQGSSKGEFPGAQQLEDARARGRLLHFFANHELLATELMALVLLRFPNAPAAFRRGVLQTLKDEQNHTRLYIERMKECGVHFGELPVSGYFWRAISGMESPMDYVAGLSLTFEQANLDFARKFSADFQIVGDAESARLLDKIYQDEIAHVAYGLKWFRRWKNPAQTDWEAFCRQLKFPLSPARAKGPVINFEGRRSAGFEARFIDELNVYSHSKGRTPSVFVFNPLAEAFIAQGKAFTPTKHQIQLVRDLENLPQFLCRQDDIVLVQRRPSVEFLSVLKQAGFALPEFVEIAGEDCGSVLKLGETISNDASTPVAPERTPCVNLATLQLRKLGRLRPWAWGPDSMELFAPLFDSMTAESRRSDQRYNGKIAQLYSKAWSAELLRKLLTRFESQRAAGNTANSPNRSESATKRWLCTAAEVGMAVDSMDAAKASIAAIRVRGHHRIVVKEALGLAGGNAIRLWEPEILPAQVRWMQRAFDNGQQLVIEPWLEREFDFSAQLEMTAEGLKLCGHTGLINDSRGQFQANWARSGCEGRIPQQAIKLLQGQADIARRVDGLYADLFSLLEAEFANADYVGPVGIDAFVYRMTDGSCRLKPLVEINPRYTMGRVTLELIKHACPGRCGEFRLLNRAAARREGHDSLASFAGSLIKRFPLELRGEPNLRIYSGVVCLNDPASAQTSLATFHVGSDVTTSTASVE